MVTRRGFLARLGGLLAGAVVVRQLPATPPPPSLLPPLMFHKDAFAIGISTAKFDPPWLPYGTSKLPLPQRLDVLYGTQTPPMGCRVLA